MLSLVTGSSGLLGHCLVSRLHERGADVRGLDLVPPDAPEIERPGEFVSGDCADASCVDAAARDVDVIFHLAAAQRMKPQFAHLDEDRIFQGNLAGVRNVLRVAERRGVRKVVVLSSSGIYGIPRTVPCREDHPTVPLGAYGRSKLAAEALCREAIERGLDVTVLRPMSLFGPRMTGVFVMLFEWVRTGRPVFVLGRGRNRVQMVSAWDVADACRLALERPEASGAFLNLGSEPDSVPTVYDEVRALVEHAGTGSTIVRIPAFALRSAARLLQPFGLSPIVPEHYILADRDFILDIGAARRVLGWQPRHDNVRMLVDAYDWYAGADERYRFRPPVMLRILNALTPRRASAG
ncbi:MAG: NAD-dependent epimerase/dehydratase family protein [Deltaproteobacteria bacterium]|nr:MAG: NAD-dependent epimerase/dehydratase family protein [Deltaproteobacteria bacterium]